MKHVLLLALAALMFAAPVSAATTYTYDTLGRVATVTYDNGKTITYSYDAAGNRTQVVTSP
jgi:YD repeat-containing protein